MTEVLFHFTLALYWASAIASGVVALSMIIGLYKEHLERKRIEKIVHSVNSGEERKDADDSEVGS